MRKNRRASRLNKRMMFELAVVILTIGIYLTGSIGALSGYATETETTEASTDTTVAESLGTDIHTMMVVSADNAVDLAIAMGISTYTDYPIMVIGEDGPTVDQLNSFAEGSEYHGVDEVVFIGGPEAMPSEVVEQFEQMSDSLENSLAGSFETTTIAGATGTETAVDAMNYLAPAAGEIYLVSYSGDGDVGTEDVETLALAGELGVIIPIDTSASEEVSGGGGLPAVVVEGLSYHPVDATLNLVGDVAADTQVEADINQLVEEGDIFEGSEIVGEPEEIINQLEQDVAENVEPGEEMIFAEIGDEMPVPQPGQTMIYYEDFNDDGIDDDYEQLHDADNDGANDQTEESLDGLGLVGMTAPDFVINQIEDGDITEVTFVGDSKEVLDNLEENIQEDYDITIETNTDPVDASQDSLITNFDQIEETADNTQDEIVNYYKEHLGEFQGKVTENLDQLRAFYTLKSDELPEGIRNDVLEALGEAGEDGSEDPVAALKLMNKIDSELFVYDYEQNDYHDDPEARFALEEDANTDINTVVEELGVSNAETLLVEEKVAIYGRATNFVLPSEASEIAKEVTHIISSTESTELGQAIQDALWNEPARQEFQQRAVEEYQAVGGDQNPQKWDSSMLAREYKQRTTMEVEAMSGNIFDYSNYQNAQQRGEFFRDFRDAYTVLQSEGIKPYALPPEAMKDAYTKYSTEGKFSEGDVEKMQAFYTATIAHEQNNPGYTQDMVGMTYEGNSVSFFDKGAGEYVYGQYSQSQQAFAYNHNGNLFVQNTDGTSQEFKAGERGQGAYQQWAYDESAGSWKSPEGAIYTPEVQKNSQGEFTYQYYDTTTGQRGEQKYSGQVYEYDHKYDGLTYYTADGESGKATYTGTYMYDPTQGYQQVTTAIPVGAEYNPQTMQYQYSGADGEKYTYNPTMNTYYNPDGSAAGTYGTPTSGSGQYGGTSSGQYAPPPGYTSSEWSGTTGSTDDMGGQYYSAPTYSSNTVAGGYTGPAYSGGDSGGMTGGTYTGGGYVGPAAPGGSYTGGDTSGGSYSGGYTGGGGDMGGGGAPAGGDGGGGGAPA